MNLLATVQVYLRGGYLIDTNAIAAGSGLFVDEPGEKKSLLEHVPCIRVSVLMGPEL
jgi:hypothetical protein